jgi:hypothetical protein
MAAEEVRPPEPVGEEPWHAIVAVVEPYVVRLSTPGGWGTGFLLAYSKTGNLAGFATAAHVVQHAHMWENPIRLDHVSSGKTRLLRQGDRSISLYADHDTGMIVTFKGDLDLPAEPLPMAPQGKHLKVGNEIGWLGFPAIPSANLCFFSGRVSAWVSELEAYLVDGNAINGVSGGPAFALVDGEIHLIGVVSAYVPNRATGEALPGLAVVRSVEKLHDEVARLTSFEEAKSEETPPSQEVAPAPAGATPTRAPKGGS